MGGPLIRFRGKLVLITGASAGIGRATASRFCSEGAKVLALARSKERLESLRAESADAARLVPVVADVADGPRMEAAAAAILREHGVPDVVVANAGIGLDARFEETSDEALRALFEVNVLGVYRTVRPFLLGMVRRGSGRILFVSSVVGRRGTPHYSGYAASKFALHGMAGALRAELHGTGVTVGLVCPSTTRTEFQEHSLRRGPGQRRVRVASHSAESVARAIVRMAGSRRRETVLGLEGKLLVWTNALAPGFLDWLLARLLVRREPQENPLSERR